MKWTEIDPVARIWLIWTFNRALGLVGPGLAALNIQTGGNTAELMAGVALTALHFAVAWFNTRNAIKVKPVSIPAPMIDGSHLPPAVNQPLTDKIDQ